MCRYPTIMGYWGRVIGRAYELTLGSAGLNGSGRFTFKIIIVLVGAFVLYQAGDAIRMIEHIGKVMGAGLAFAIAFLVLFVVQILRAAAQIDREQRATIDRLSAELEDTIDLQLVHRSAVAFEEICENREIQRGWKPLNRWDLLHRLLKALWRGDFEDDAGVSRLKLDGGEASRYRMLSVAALQWPGSMGIPNVAQMVDENPPSWDALRPQVDFERLAAISPDDYEDVLLENYYDKITMTGDDLRAWFRRLRSGTYER